MYTASKVSLSALALVLAGVSLAQGQGVNGSIRATGTADTKARVSATKRARRSDPAEVEVKVVTHEQGVTICAVYPTPSRARHQNECGPGRGYHSSTEDNDVVVDFTVEVPAGVEFFGETVNGGVQATGLHGNVETVTVNGGIDVSTTGYAEATTVNGSIEATLGRADWQGDASFQTVNGGITLNLPANLSADLRAETVNGEFESDFPVTISGRFGPRHVSGKIGDGGRRLDLRTVNGAIRLRKT